MSNFGAFATGFMTTAAANIQKRKDDASEYYKEQLKRAQALGDTKLKERRERLDSIKIVANNLTQTGMPDDILKALANEGPEALEMAYKVYSEAASAGDEIDEGFWRSTYKFSEQAKGNDQTNTEFLENVYGNLQKAPKEPASPDGVKKSPFDRIVSSTFGWGHNAMDKAVERLDNTDIGGMSASDALGMENSPTVNRQSGVGTVTADLEEIAAREAEIKRKNKPPRDMPFSDVKGYQTVYEEAIKQGERDLNAEEGRVEGSPISPEERAAIEAEAAEQVFTMAGSDAPELAKRIPSLGKYYTDPEGEEAPAEVTEEYTPPKEIELPDGGVMEFVSSDGKYATYKNVDGKNVRIELEVIKQNMPQDDEEDTPTEVPQEAVQAPVDASSIPAADTTAFDIGAALEASNAEDLTKANIVIPSDAVLPSTFTAKGKQYTFRGMQALANQDMAIFSGPDGEELVIPIGE